MKFLSLLLAAATDSAATTSSAGAAGGGDFFSTWGIWIILLAVLVVMFVFNFRARKKQETEMKNKMDALKPGDDIETIGRIYGTIVSIDNDNETILIKTGDDEHCGYIKIDKLAVYRTIPELSPVAEENLPENNQQTEQEQAASANEPAENNVQEEKAE